MNAATAAQIAYPNLPQVDFCADTYTDALTWDAERLERETRALCDYMSFHWAITSEENKATLLREKRALRMAALARMTPPTPPPAKTLLQMLEERDAWAAQGDWTPAKTDTFVDATGRTRTLYLYVADGKVRQ